MTTRNGTELGTSVLDRLIDEDPRAGDPTFDTLDIKNPSSLAIKLTNPGTVAMQYLRDTLRPETRAVLERQELSSTSTELLMALTKSLNDFINGPLLYERKRFEGVKLTHNVLRLMEESRTATPVKLLNRLLLEELFPDELRRMRPPSQVGGTIRDLKKAVARDIELLLNTRHECLQGLPAQFTELDQSILMLGLPDFTSYSLLSPEHRKTIRRSVEDALMKFEPRLKSVTVTLEPPRKFDAALHFRIEALLRTDPAPEPVTFDAALQLGSSSYSVRGEI